ncbi:hypothetical protein PICMEDRAFT_59857 [Pichia membranifaciens NRRL Y-2026]|uniref:Glyoxylate reductase n=1 Tax=Pichia membranifaciens NRRL Y-2026 TaxID=763406 RepID=A0A1E3NI56_9ASCO|nr:hypothetical protein PICMEDRAFT_59857 [Pichia membranifaciens NRRL Y-2026]ODQ45023.1 hypothetical protein PICMEDRAFT_59857 [Pichia membranifaciens NRRL Y-2026]
MTFAESGERFTVLRLPPIRYAGDIWDEFEQKNSNVRVVETAAKNREEFIAQLKRGELQEVDFIARTFQSVKQTGLFDKELLELIVAHTQVKGIAHCGAGYDQVDANACRDLKLQLSNVPGRVNDSTADTNVFLILATLRNFQLGHENLMKGRWKTDINSAGTIYGHCIQNKVVGILGMGGIGQTVRDRLAGFGVKKIVYYNRSRLSPELEQGCEYCGTMEELAEQSDVISINIPLNKDTHHVINASLIAKMKDGVVLVNTARGPVVDEAAVKAGLRSGKIFGYGTDVFENEPDIDMDFASLPNVTSLPHMGTATVETIRSMEALVVENVDAFYRTGKVKTLVAELQGVF